MTQTIYIALGSNLGDRLAHLRAAVEALENQPDCQINAKSRVYETSPVGGPAGQGPYLNAVLRLETNLPPQKLLQLLFEIEERQGRERRVHWGPRTLDLDLLLYGAALLQTPALIIPHPRLAERAFVLAPLAELAPDLSVPGKNQSVTALLNQVERTGLSVTDFSF
jgi:2-amino-4-hydroxy-6-hydroxymethyldihydropteridine diphosphokinase